MNMFIKEYLLDILFIEGKSIVLYIENPKDYRYILQNLWKQVNGEVGQIILSEKEKELKIEKEIAIIFNPFSLDCNERKVITKLYQEIKENIETEYIQETIHLQTEILDYLNTVLGSVPYPLEYNSELNLFDLFKMTGVKNEDLMENILEKIIQYIRVLSQICHINIFLFVGLKAYIQETEIQQLYEYCSYNKIYLIDVETKYESCLDSEKVWIIDEDSCIIELN